MTEGREGDPFDVRVCYPSRGELITMGELRHVLLEKC